MDRRRIGSLPETSPLEQGWELQITEEVWPTALIAAVRRDVGAIATPRAIETLRWWQRKAADPRDPDTQKRAIESLEALAGAISPRPPSKAHTPSPRGDDRTADGGDRDPVDDADVVDADNHLDNHDHDDVPTAAILIQPKRVVSRGIGSTQKRPRAAIHHVDALCSVIRPLCDEIVPLTPERRRRRFWARWREVTGDRGVRRDFVDGLLESAKDVRTLLCELIAEVQTVDVQSVYLLFDAIERGDRTAPIAHRSSKSPGTPERQRGPLVGASVRVEGVPADAEPDE